MPSFSVFSRSSARDSSNGDACLSSACDSTTHPVTEIVPEIAHRIGQCRIRRHRDNIVVLVESLWKKELASESDGATTAGESYGADEPGGCSGASAVRAASSAVGSPCCPPDDTVTTTTIGSVSTSVGSSSAHSCAMVASLTSSVPSLSASRLLLYSDRVRDDAPIVATATGQPVLLCLFRRWGCCICRMTAASLSAIKPFLAQKGIRLVGIGYEEVGLKKFLAARHFVDEIFIDDEKQLYRSFECNVVSWTSAYGVFSPDVLRLYNAAKERGFVNNFEGDYSQFGGVALIDSNGITRYVQIQTKERFEIDTRKILLTIGVTPPEDFDPLPRASQAAW